MKLDGEKLLADLVKQKEAIKQKASGLGADEVQIRIMIVVIDEIIDSICKGDYTIKDKG